MSRRLDQRRHRRLPAMGAARVRRADGEQVAVTVRDVSRCGAFVEASVCLPVGELVTLELSPPAAPAELAVPATVVRGPAGAGNPGMGLEFGDLPEALGPALELWLDRLAGPRSR